MDWGDIITKGVAVWGILLTTVVVTRQIRKERPIVKVTLSLGRVTLQSGKFSNTQLLLRAANTGDKPVTLSGHFVKLPNKKKLFFPKAESDVSFPHELAPGKSCSLWVGNETVMNYLRARGFHGIMKVRGSYSDQTEREYVSKPIQLEVG